MPRGPIFEISLDGCCDARYISYKERHKKGEWFIDSKNKALPVMNCTDVHAASHGGFNRYKGPISFSEFKSKLTHRAKELGCESSLPDEWKKDKKD